MCVSLCFSCCIHDFFSFVFTVFVPVLDSYFPDFQMPLSPPRGPQTSPSDSASQTCSKVNIGDRACKRF